MNTFYSKIEQRIVDRNEVITFTNEQGFEEKFGLTDFDSSEKRAEAQIIPCVVEDTIEFYDMGEASYNEEDGVMYITYPDKAYDEDAENEQTKQNRIAEIMIEFREIDNASIRPIRAGETTKIAELEARAEALRLELAELEG